MIIDPSGWKLDGETTLNSKSPMASLMTKSARLLTATRKRDNKALSCLIVTIWPLTLVFTVFEVWAIGHKFIQCHPSKLSQSSISRHIFSGTTARVARLSISPFRKGLPCSVIMVMIFATFIKSRLSPMAVWWTKLYILVWIAAYFFNSCTILQKVRAIIKYCSRACSLPVIPIKPPFIFISLCSCSMQWYG